MSPQRHTKLHLSRIRAGWRGTLAIAAVAWLCAAPQAVEARPLITGVTNIGTRAPEAFAQTRATGASFIRIPLHWGGTAPESLPTSWNPTDPEDPNYQWGESDDDVIRAIAAGLIPVLQVDGTPSWAQRCRTPVVLRPAICDPDPGALGAFAVAAARRYSGAYAGIPKVSYWQALNEPNLSLFFFPQFSSSGKALSPYLYRALINAFYAGIKAVDPGNLVLLAGLGPNAVRTWTIGPMSFARQMLCMRNNSHPRRGNCGGGVHFDIFAIQPYTTGGPTHEGRANDVQIGDLGKLRKLIRAANRAGRIKGTFKRTPLWITEFSWDTKPPDPGGLPMRIATRWTAEALHTAWRAGVTRFFWYSLRDDAPSGRPNGESLESGLYFRGATIAEDRPKKLLGAFRFPIVAYARKRGKPALDFWGRTPTSKSGRVTLQALRGGKWRRIGRARADRFGIFRGRLRSGYGRGSKGSVRAVYHGQLSVPFSMKRVGDFRHPPFGKPVG